LPWSTLLLLVPPLLLPLLLLLPLPLLLLLLLLLAPPLLQLTCCTPCSIAISSAGAAPTPACPLSRSLAPSFDRRCRCRHCIYARLPSHWLAGSLVQSLLLALLVLLLPSLVLPLWLWLQLLLCIHPRSLSLVAHHLCASILCSPCLLSVV
jgi:hypothetical protein